MQETEGLGARVSLFDGAHWTTEQLASHDFDYASSVGMDAQGNLYAFGPGLEVRRKEH